MNNERAYATIDLKAAEQNYTIIRTSLSPGVKMMCVVKANAYGHGAQELARLWEGLGADMFAVACAEEAVQLVEGGIHTPCLVLGYVPPHYVQYFVEHNILPSIYSYEQAVEWNAAATRSGKSLPCHIKIDTGMLRYGIPWEDAPKQLPNFLELKHLVPEGIFTHLSRADDNPNFTCHQIHAFNTTADLADKIFGRHLLRHCANTAAIGNYSLSNMDMVRAGIGLYGYGMPHVTPLMQLEARITDIKPVQKGQTIGYGNAGIAPEDGNIAILSIGYADGLRREAGDKDAHVTINGIICPVIGRVCMDCCMVFMKHNVCAAVGDYAVIFGKQPHITADMLASALHTISYEILTSVGTRVTRYYI